MIVDVKRLTLRELAGPSYLVSALLMVGPMLDVVARVWPLQIGDASWRISAGGVALNGLVTPLLGTLLFIGTATLQLRVRALRAVAIALFGAVALLGVLTILFLIDYVVIRRTMEATALGEFDVAARQALLAGVLSGAVAGFLGRASWRLAHAEELTQPPQSPEGKSGHKVEGSVKGKRILFPESLLKKRKH